jgi:hypothetical protein
MPAHQTLGATARMKRSGAELPLCTWSGCGGRLNRVAVATGKRGGGGDAARALLRFVKMFRVGCSNAPSRPLGAAQSALLRGASLWAAECGMHVIWPCGGVRPREMRAEGRRRRRRPWKPSINQQKRMLLLLCRFRSCDSSAAIPECSPTPLHYPLIAAPPGARARSRKLRTLGLNTVFDGKDR